jgi:hypothetical protein
VEIAVVLFEKHKRMLRRFGSRPAASSGVAKIALQL